MILFAKRFKKERLKRKLTQEELANYFNTNKSNISKYENGNSFPGIKTIKKYADFFDVSIDYLLGRVDIPYYHKLPDEIKNLLQNEDFKYLKIASQLQKNNIPPKTAKMLLDLYKKIKSEIID